MKIAKMSKEPDKSTKNNGPKDWATTAKTASGPSIDKGVRRSSVAPNTHSLGPRRT